MIYITNLDNKTVKSLEEIMREDSRYRSRDRAKAILLSNQGKNISELIDIFGYSRRTFYRWFNRFKPHKIEELHDAKGRGRKANLNIEKHEKIVKEIVKKKININEIIIELEREFNPNFKKLMEIKWSTEIPAFSLLDYSKDNILNYKNNAVKITKRMLKRFFKKIGISYKRARKSIFKDAKWKTYWSKVAQIQSVKSFVKNELCELYYFDESGFSMNSNIPYAWSEINKPLEVSSDRWGKRLNVLGFLNTENKDLFFEIVDGTVNSEIVINFFDRFSDQLEINTVVILDNASIHKSKLFKQNIEKWEEKGLFLLYLPPYSPELNLIEILWREIKYRWMDIASYLSFENLFNHVNKVLKNFGKNYDINFS